MTHSTTTPKQFWIIAYDISHDKRRNKVAKVLENFGTRCNYSVFECLLTESAFAKMQSRLNKIIDTSQDSILYYYLCKSCIPKKTVHGKSQLSLPEVIVI